MSVATPKPKPVRGTSASRRSVVVVVLAAVALTAGLIVLALLLQNRGGSSASPTPVVDLAGIPESGTVLGSPKAKVTLVEYADIQCPACRMYMEDVFPTVVNEFVRPGTVKTEFRGFPFIGDDSLKGERFLLAAAEQNRMWPLMEAFYRHQGGENSGWLTDDLVRNLASDIPGLDVDKLFARAESAEIGKAAQQRAVISHNELLQHMDQPATPTLLVQVGDQKPYLIQVAAPSQMRDALNGALSE